MQTNNTLNIFWKREQQLKKQEEKIDQLIPENRDILKDYRKSYSNGTKNTTIAKTLYGLIKYAKLLEKSIINAEIQDLEKALYSLETAKTINGTPYTAETKAGIKKSIKQFYKWFENYDPRLESGNTEIRTKTQKLYKYLTKIKTSVKLKPVNPQETIDEEDIKQLIKNGCRNDMERAFIKTLHESGCRISEFLSIKLKDINKKETNWIIYVDGKTGSRSVFIIESIPYLQRWLDFHPNKNLDSYLWTSQASKRPLNYAGCCKLLKRVFRRAGINKKCNPHWFRHSRASIHAGKFTETIRCKLMGWSLSSNIPARYTHLKDSMIEDKFREAHGLIELETKTKHEIPVKCVCGRENEPNARYCSLCGKPLSVNIIVEDEEKKNDAISEALEIFAQILSDPEMRVRFEKFKEEKRK